MKYFFRQKKLLPFFLSLLVLAGCELEQKPEGNGNVTTTRRNARNFKELEINGIFNVYVSQSNTYKLEVITDDNLQSMVNSETVDSVLYISTKENETFNATRMDVYITMPDIKRIDLQGVNSFYCTDTLQLERVSIDKANTGFMKFNAVLDRLTIHTSDVGNLELNGKSNRLEINNEMTGDIYAYGFKTNDLTLVHSGTGNVQVFVTNSVNAELNGVGDVYCKGYPANISKTVNGVGRFYVVN